MQVNRIGSQESFTSSILEMYPEIICSSSQAFSRISASKIKPDSLERDLEACLKSAGAIHCLVTSHNHTLPLKKLLKGNQERVDQLIQLDQFEFLALTNKFDETRKDALEWIKLLQMASKSCHKESVEMEKAWERLEFREKQTARLLENRKNSSGIKTNESSNEGKSPSQMQKLEEEISSTVSVKINELMKEMVSFKEIVHINNLTLTELQTFPLFSSDRLNLTTMHDQTTIYYYELDITYFDSLTKKIRSYTNKKETELSRLETLLEQFKKEKPIEDSKKKIFEHSQQIKLLKEKWKAIEWRKNEVEELLEKRKTIIDWGKPELREFRQKLEKHKAHTKQKLPESLKELYGNLDIHNPTLLKASLLVEKLLSIKEEIEKYNKVFTESPKLYRLYSVSEDFEMGQSMVQQEYLTDIQTFKDLTKEINEFKEIKHNYIATLRSKIREFEITISIIKSKTDFILSNIEQIESKLNERKKWKNIHP